MIVQLSSSDDQEVLGLVRIANIGNGVTSDVATEEIEESWNIFHVQAEHDLDSSNIDDFVTWNNEKWWTQIERIYIDLFL
jgi:hypothetical protein